MVGLQFDGMCEGCKRAELELEKLDMYTLEGDIDNLWNVVCVHELVCKEWNNKLNEDKLKNV